MHRLMTRAEARLEIDRRIEAHLAPLRRDLSSMQDKQVETRQGVTVVAQILRDVTSTIQTYFQHNICLPRAQFLKGIINHDIMRRLTAKEAIP